MDTSKMTQILLTATLAIVLIAVIILFSWLLAILMFGAPADPLFELLFGQQLQPGNGLDTGGHV